MCVLKTWDISTSVCLSPFIIDNCRLSYHNISFSFDKTKIIYCCGDGSIKIWDINTNSIIVDLGVDCTCSCAISHDNNLIITGSIDTNARILTIDGLCLHKMKHNNTIFTVSFNHNSTLAISNSRPLVKVWNVETGLCLYHFVKYISYISFNNDDNNLIVSVSRTEKGDKITFCDIKEKLPLTEIQLYRSDVTSIAFNCEEFGFYF